MNKEEQYCQGRGEHGTDLASERGADEPPCFPQFASTGTGWHATSTPGGCPSLTAPRRVDLTASLRPRVTDVNGVGGKPCLITDATKR
jgi:hypothetical protein